MSAATVKQTIVRWLFGQRFHLHSPLSEIECKRRMGQFSSGAFAPPVTDDPVAICKRQRVYVWLPFQRRGPWLVGRLRSTGDSTEITGRAGVDFTSLAAAVGMEALLIGVVILPAPHDPFGWALLLFPIAAFFYLRKSPYGDDLIYFLQQLLDAQNLFARNGDPIQR